MQGNPVSYTDPFGLSPINGLFSGTNAIHNALLIGSIVLPEPFGALCDFVDGTIYLLVDHDVANALGSYASIVAPGAVGLAFRGINKLHDMSKSGVMISKLLGRISAEATQYGDDLASYWFKSDAQKFVPEVSKADELGTLTKIDDDVLDWQKASGRTSIPTREQLHDAVTQWAKMKQSIASNRQLNKFKVATVVYDSEKGIYYYGMNRGIRMKGDEVDDLLLSWLPEKSLNHLPVGNCAEVDAVNQALKAKANVKNLYMYTIDVETYLPKAMCDNCIYTFAGRVAEVFSH